MPAQILDGTKLASEIRAEVAAEVQALAAEGIRPGLAVILVGNNPASEVYVRGKVKSSKEVGLYSEQHSPAESISTEELLALSTRSTSATKSMAFSCSCHCPRTSTPRKFFSRSIRPKTWMDSTR